MCSSDLDTTNNGVSQEKNLFSFQDVLPDRKIQVDFNAPDISSNGGLVLVGLIDSRYWGFVPEDHVVGKPIVVWLSLDKDRGWFDGKIRWNRLFKWVD